MCLPVCKGRFLPLLSYYSTRKRSLSVFPHAPALRPFGIPFIHVFLNRFRPSRASIVACPIIVELQLCAPIGISRTLPFQRGFRIFSVPPYVQLPFVTPGLPYFRCNGPLYPFLCSRSKHEELRYLRRIFFWTIRSIPQ